MDIFLTLVGNTMIKEYRRKTLVFVLILTCAFILLGAKVLSFLKTEVFSQLAMFDLGTGSLNVALIIVTGWCVLLGAYFGSNTIREDIKNKTLMKILTLPISRTQYVLARFTGCYLLVICYYLFSIILASTAFSLASDANVLHPGIFLALIFCSFAIFAGIGLSLFFSFFFGKIASLLLTFITMGFISAAQVSFGNKDFSTWFENMGLGKGVLLFVYGVISHISFWMGETVKVLLSTDLSSNYLFEVPHLIISLGLLILALLVLFRKKDF